MNEKVRKNIKLYDLTFLGLNSQKKAMFYQKF